MSSGNLDSPLGGTPSGLTFIEQLHALSVQLCSNPKVPFISGFDGDTMYMMRGSCGSWSCPTCGARNAKQWLARMLNHMNTTKSSGRWYFLTVTAHEKWRGQSSSIKNIRKGWKKLYNRVRRKYGISEYVKVWEYHKDGSFHLHVLIKKKIGKRWLKDNSRACGMGYQCDSSKSKNAGQVAGYVSKYLIKSFENADRYEKGMRRIEASRNWKKLPELESDINVWVVHQSRDKQNEYSRSYINDKYKKVDLRPSVEKEMKIIDLN